MAYQVKLSPNAGTAIERAVRGKAEIVVRREAARVAAVAVEEAVKLARSDLYTDRPASRRRSPGTARYVNGFTATVENTHFPFVIKIRNRSPIANIIENGRGPSHITGNPNLAIPVESFTGKGRKRTPSHSEHSNVYGSKHVIRTRQATSPGNDGYKIMERALRAAFRLRGASLRATK